MSEKVQFHENFVEKREKQENSSDSVNIKDKIHKEAIDFYKKNQKYPDSIENLKELLTRQNTEDLQLFEFFEVQKDLTINESKNNRIPIKNEKQKNILKLSPTQTKELIKIGNTELQKINENINKQNEKINSKIVQINLILDISGMYKEYLQSILGNIKAKFISQKDERYENQITIIENKIKKIDNIIEYLSLVGNTSDLLDININDLLNELIVSEEKISSLGNFDQPFTFDKTKSVEGVNKGYEYIKKLLGNPNIKDIENIRLKIFDKIRSYDGVDDDKHRYNTSEGIRTRISGNILDNKDLNKDGFIKNSFDLIKNFGENKKIEFYQALNFGKDKLKDFFNNIKLFDTLGIKDDKQKNKLLENIFNTLKEGKDNIDDNKLKELIKKEIQDKINYLKNQKQKNKNLSKEDEVNKKIDEKIKELENIKNDNNNLNKQLEEIKRQTIFKTFERIIIKEVLEKKKDLVTNLSKQNTDIRLYSDIEGIGNLKMSDERFNSISTGTQFLAEQIVIMGISGGVGSFAVRGVGNVLRLGKTVSLLDGGMNLANIGKLGLNTIIDGGAFYLTYTGLNGLINEKEANQLFSKLDKYDAVRTIFFLGILRSLNKTREAFNVKNILLDTKDILLTDIIVRGTLGELLGKEGIEGVDLKNLKNTDLIKIGEFLTKELYYIIPLVIGLRLTDKTINNIIKNKSTKVEVNQTEKEIILKIELGDIKKEIRILKQKRDILKNRGKKVKYIREVNNELKEKKAEYKKTRDLIDSQNKNLDYKAKIIPKIQNNTNQTTKDDKNDKKTNPEDNVNMNVGNPTRYERLKQYSEQAQKGKIDYVLGDKEIGKILTEKGIGTEGKSVGEGLLKKSGFSKDEIKDYNEGKLKSEKVEKPIEKNSLREMERANEVIYKGFKDLDSRMDKGISQGEKLSDILKEYSPENIKKILQILKKGGY